PLRADLTDPQPAVLRAGAEREQRERDCDESRHGDSWAGCAQDTRPLESVGAEARGFRSERERGRLVGVNRLRAREQIVLALAVVRIGHAAVDRADLGALLLGVEADALGAQTRVDDERLFALADGLVRALRLADAAVDAFLGDHGRHGRIPR